MNCYKHLIDPLPNAIKINHFPVNMCTFWQTVPTAMYFLIPFFPFRQLDKPQKTRKKDKLGQSVKKTPVYCVSFVSTNSRRSSQLGYS